MAIAVGKLSRWDTLRFFCLVSVPATLWGLAAPNRLLVGLLARWNVGAATVHFLSGLRRKYRSSYLRLWFPFPGDTTLLVMDPHGMDAVLASDANAADPKLKKNTLSQFIPDALVISSGAEWRVRRDFNENMLRFGYPLHRHADAFVQIIAAEAEQLAHQPGSELCWEDFQTLAERISHQVLLGQGHVEPAMTAHLARMVKRSNWYVLPRDGAAFSAFYKRIDAYLFRRSAEVNSETASIRCLMADSAELVKSADYTPLTCAPTQIGFWFFVLKDALELHVARTLALIVAHPEVYDQVQREVDAMGTAAAQSIDDLHYLEACVGEGLRLWTPVPILLRRAISAFSLPGEIAIDPGQQILIHAGFYHRDVDFFGEAANKFSPKVETHDALPRVYIFSSGRQSCAGQFLARFLLKATLASLLTRFRFELLGPRIEMGNVQYLYDHFKIRFRVSPVTRKP
jgi:cytochrome P450